MKLLQRSILVNKTSKPVEDFLFTARHVEGWLVEADMHDVTEDTDDASTGKSPTARNAIVPPSSVAVGKGSAIIAHSQQRGTFLVKLFIFHIWYLIA